MHKPQTHVPDKGTSVPRGIWRARGTTYPSHLVQRGEHLLQLLHLLPRHRLIVPVQILHVCVKRRQCFSRARSSCPPKRHTKKRLHGWLRRSRHSERCLYFSSELLLPALPPSTWLAFLHTQQRYHLPAAILPWG